MAWLLVLARADAAEWVIANRRMAFRSHVAVDRIVPDDPVALYLTKGAFGTPHRDLPRIVALGNFQSQPIDEPIAVAGEQFSRWCELHVEHVLPLRGGLEFKPLVPQLDFITSKKAWPAYLQRTLKQISTRDFETIETAFLQKLLRPRG